MIWTQSSTILKSQYDPGSIHLNSKLITAINIYQHQSVAAQSGLKQLACPSSRCNDSRPEVRLGEGTDCLWIENFPLDQTGLRPWSLIEPDWRSHQSALIQVDCLPIDVFASILGQSEWIDVDRLSRINPKCSGLLAGKSKQLRSADQPRGISLIGNIADPTLYT